MTVWEREFIFREVVPIAGFYHVERDELGPFVWTGEEFTIRKPDGIRFVDLFMCYYGRSGKLVIDNEAIDEPLEIALTQGWARYAIDMQSEDQCDLKCDVIPVTSVPGELRKLGVMIRDFRPFQDRSMYELVRMKMMNKYENAREFFAGCTRLDSFPTRLRVDIETRCNMRPRCSYCEWQWIKKMERHAPLDDPLNTLYELGRFFECAEEVVDCGYGEPLLNRNLEAIFQKIGSIGARFEMTTNGHLLDFKNRNRLLGKNIILYVSIDAASDTGYRRFRHGSLNIVMKNVQSLCREKTDHNDLPRTIISFIAMRSNVNEFEAFLDRVAEMGADAVKVRSLYENPMMPEDLTARDCSGFNYQSEILTLVELMRFLDVAKALATSRGVTLISEFDFCRELEQVEGPICSEPWQALYVLNRGLLPCCFSKVPLRHWDKRRERSLIQFITDSWNGDLMREIREALTAGELHEICEMSTSCPVVKRKISGSASFHGPARRQGRVQGQ